MKNNFKILTISLVAFAIGLTAGNYAISDVPANFKVAVVDVQKVVASSAQVKALKEEQKKKSQDLAKFIETAKCDYVIAVTTVVSEKTHPTWRFWATTNYSVRLTGIPIYMEKITRETITPEKVVLEASTDSYGNVAAELKERGTGEAVRKDVDMTPLRKISK